MPILRHWTAPIRGDGRLELGGPKARVLFDRRTQKTLMFRAARHGFCCRRWKTRDSTRMRL